MRAQTGSSLGLALSGGAALGFAHIGVLQALDEAGLEITHLAGTSSGALVAAFYAFGFTGREIQAVAEGLGWTDITRPSPSRLGLLSQERLQKLLRDRLGDVRLEEASIPLAMIAADIETGEKVVMTEGDLALAASASACFPGIFLPVELDGRLLVDGGLVENLPLSPLKAWGVQRIVGVDVFLGMTFGRPRNLLHLIKNAVDIALVHTSRDRTDDAHVLVTPDLHAFNSTELRNVPGLVKEGYRATVEVMDRL